MNIVSARRVLVVVAAALVACASAATPRDASEAAVTHDVASTCPRDFADRTACSVDSNVTCYLPTACIPCSGNRYALQAPACGCQHGVWECSYVDCPTSDPDEFVDGQCTLHSYDGGTGSGPSYDAQIVCNDANCAAD